MGAIITIATITIATSSTGQRQNFVVCVFTFDHKKYTLWYVQVYQTKLCLSPILSAHEVLSLLYAIAL